MNNQAVEIEKEEINKLHVLDNIKNLPTIPVILNEVNSLIDDPKVSVNKLKKIISKDQGMVSKILAVANSPFYGIPKKVSSIDFAIVILGFSQVKNIVISLSMIEVFSKYINSKWDRAAFAKHSFLTGVLANKIAEDLSIGRPGQAFTAGLLHDMGVSIIQRHFKSDYEKILKMVNEEEITYLDAEKKVLSVDHQEIGRYLASKWNLPDAICDAVLNHHNPSACENYKELSSVVHIAEYILQNFKIGTLDWDTELSFDMKVIEYLNLGSENFFDKFVEQYKSLLQKQNSLT